jgi:hypothetical protein
MIMLKLFSVVFSQVIMFATTASLDYSCKHSSTWRMNTGKKNLHLGLQTDILKSSMNFTSSGGNPSNQWRVSTYGIPNYDSYLLTSSDISALNSRTNAATEFRSGKTIAVAGNSYDIGEDVGYKLNCGYGYWPPDVPCPSTTLGLQNFTVSLLPAYESSSSGCYARNLSAIGYWVTGAAIYSATSGRSYKNQGVWHVVDPFLESSNDLDVCQGRPESNGVYIHRQFSKCLQSRVVDKGLEHSPIYGWMLDGYPIHGPFQEPISNGFPNPSKSCWKTRSYSSSPGRARYSYL